MKREPFADIETICMDRAELAYHKINGLVDESAAPDVPDETGAGGCLEWYITQIYEARKLLCAKHGISFDRDPDLERIIDSYEAICRKCGLLMYQYGLRDGLARRQ